VSLRARLVATLLALAAVGMVVLAAVTYTSQRDFELDRIDDQTRAALPAIGAALERAGGFRPAFDGRGGHGPGHRPGGPEANLPPGTYGEQRDGSGRVLARVALDYGAETFPIPDVPADLAAGEVRTVDAVGGDLRYRVQAFPSRATAGVTIVAVPLAAVEETLDRLLLVEALVIGGVLLALAALASALVRLGLRPLDRIGTTAGAIAGGDLSHRVDVADPRTEVGRLGLSLNAMLGRLEDAFAEREASEQRLRTFLSDASHELRTPLAAIRGYAEVFRMGAAADPEDLARAMRRIEEEAARMGVLVEDLLVLARLDEDREQVRERVDLTVLVHDAAADARAMDPERPVDADDDGPLPVLGDPDALRQVLGNLVRNALVHTPPGTAVELHARGDDGHAELEVRDHGPGLPPGDPQALFERFWRQEGGRKQGPAGAGLGLAIVHGITTRHGGTVTARDADGGGASFIVRLPVAG